MKKPPSLDAATWNTRINRRMEAKSRQICRKAWIAGVICLITLYVSVCLFIYAVTHAERTMTQLFLSLPEIVQPWSWE